MQTQKKIKQTDAIFAKLKVVNTAADETKTVLRVSWDAKTAVKIGDFVRGGQNRLARKGADHDFKPEALLNPFGILLPQWDDLNCTSPRPPSRAISSLICWSGGGRRSENGSPRWTRW